MAENRPYKVVVEALAAQTVAIGRLAKEIKVEFAQYQAAQAAEDEAKAQRIADAINSRTDKLVSAAEQLAASNPDAVVGGGPADPTGRPDNELPDRDRPTDPGYGVEAPVDPGFGGGRPGGPDGGYDRPEGGRPGNDLPNAPARPGNDLPNAPARPGNDLPEQPVDPGFGGGRPNRPDVDNDLPDTPGSKPVEPEEGGGAQPKR